jgi:hypothetical protein
MGDYHQPWPLAHEPDSLLPTSEGSGRSNALPCRRFRAHSGHIVPSFADFPGRNLASVLFNQELRDDVLAGEITVSFRLWKRPKVKPGGR